MGNWVINPNAFEPAKDDADGISFFREDFVSKEHLASVSTHGNGVRVGRVLAKECTALSLSLKPAPDPSQPPGHLVIPEMLFIKKTPETKEQKRKIQDLAQKLAQLASNNEVYTPPGMPDPIARPRS